MKQEPAVGFSDFTFKYFAQSKPTLKNINLTINKGEKILIIGPSGSGKSTLGNCINGLIPHSYKGKIEGSLQVAGKNPSAVKISDLSKSIGTVLQDTDGQFVGLSVVEDIVFALENDLVPTPELRRRAAEVAELVGLGSVLKNSPQEVSGGQKQRTSLGGVLVDDVDILLFDEPLANLDPATGKKAMELIDDIHRKSGKTVIIIEHRIEDVLHRNVDRIVLMHEGEIVADMAPHDMIASDLFFRYGIREPLYVTLLKYAGIKITPEMNPAYMSSIDIDSHKEEILRWYRAEEIDLPEAKGEETLGVKDLTFAYTSRKILKDINFSIKKGEMLAIVGRNGAGKSTLSKLICGFEKGHSGEILFNGENAGNRSIAERATVVGYVMQNPNHMITEHRIFDEIALGLRLRGIGDEEIAERVEKTMRICGLERFMKWPISALSYGQKKRVTIASILVLEPEILILDEPTAGQDYRHYTEIMEFLKELNRKLGITIILITHDMHLMMEYTKRSIVLSEGELIADTDSSDVLTNVDIVEKGSLKETSIYHIARHIGIDNPKSLVDRFISHETALRRDK
ncbi:ABC transporter ATP-binding protein [Spirochaeta isovalerica]|uniref:Energy-coupling factor transport system ATP-binding protein n=1 Tax=Spirochaeta isovalerica TaxID=150 RepID=A0A841RBA3_9SPIO|nr:ABC transporter ATP-binding protein [Spirochaeta isovalerica]MBB6480527.1 energy-coupling factor transport system ATP-binding protein [Spirochaeta isovalerica]